MNKLMYRFVATTKKRNRPVFRHGMLPQGIPHNKSFSEHPEMHRTKEVPSLNYSDLDKVTGKLLKKTSIRRSMDIY